MIKVLILVYCYSLRQNNTSSPYRATKYLDHVTSSFTPYIIYTLYSTHRSYNTEHNSINFQLSFIKRTSSSERNHILHLLPYILRSDIKFHIPTLVYGCSVMDLKNKILSVARCLVIPPVLMRRVESFIYCAKCVNC